MEKEARFGAAVREFVTKHPYITIGTAGALIGGASGALKAHFNRHDDQGRRLSQKKQKQRRILYTVGGAVQGLASGLYSASQVDQMWNEAKRSTYYDQRRRYERGSNGEAQSAPQPDTGVPDWLKGVKTKAEAKSKWREVAFKHHPDRGGNAETFKKRSAEWDSFEKHHFEKLSHLIASFQDELMRIRRTA